jgi:shikimate dehydrogenase
LMGASEISATTRLCAVYGHPVKHSASPAMHNAAIKALGLNWRYLAFDVHPDSLREAIRGAAAMKFIGLNLTVPHKILAMDIVDELDESARTWGAVNTVLFEGQTGGKDWSPLRDCNLEAVTAIRTRGFNTDANAITRSLHEDLGMQLPGATVLLLGAGGAGRTAALKLASEGVKDLFLINRTMSKAEEVAGEIQKRFPRIKTAVGYPQGPVDLVINGTSLGLKADDPLPFDSDRFSLKDAGAAYDMIYRPAETRFLAEATRAGCKVANGLGMLLYQGARALEIWSGMAAPVDVMRAALKEQIYGNA